MDLPSTTHRGQAAELRAWAWLTTRPGQRRLLTRNYRKRTGEIDLIFEEAGPKLCLVFLEVRSRVSGYIRPIDSVSLSKRLRIERTAAQYLLVDRGAAREIRFDCLEVRGEGDQAEFVWWPNAW